MLLKRQQHRYEYQPTRSARPLFTSALKIIVILNAGIFILEQIFPSFARFCMTYLASIPADQVFKLRLWQSVTSQFLHAGAMHLVGNMLILILIGGFLEVQLGTKRFVWLYLLSGIGADYCATIARWGSEIPAIGASGAVFGVLGAASWTIGAMTIYVWGIIPMKMRHYAWGLMAIELLIIIQGVQDGIGHWAHLGGGIFGYLIARYYDRALPLVPHVRISGRKGPPPEARGRFTDLDIPGR